MSLWILQWTKSSERRGSKLTLRRVPIAAVARAKPYLVGAALFVTVIRVPTSDLVLFPTPA
jgi:hypothetical protein